MQNKTSFAHWTTGLGVILPLQVKFKLAENYLFSINSFIENSTSFVDDVKSLHNVQINTDIKV